MGYYNTRYNLQNVCVRIRVRRACVRACKVYRSGLFAAGRRVSLSGPRARRGEANTGCRPGRACADVKTYSRSVRPRVRRHPVYTSARARANRPQNEVGGGDLRVKRRRASSYTYRRQPTMEGGRGEPESLGSTPKFFSSPSRSAR